MYCSVHWKEEGHGCALYDPAKLDNRVPSCPLCALPVTFPVGTDPNSAMDAHLEGSCAILNPPDTATSSSKRPKAKLPPGAMTPCTLRGCGSKMVVPMRCQSCRSDFCAKHRFASDHACVAVAVPKASDVKSQGNWARLASVAADLTKSTPTPSKPSPRPARVAAPTIPTRATPATQLVVAAPPARPRKPTKQALAERASARRAMDVRARKGLLSEREKVEYATMVAEEANGGGKGKDCIVS